MVSFAQDLADSAAVARTIERLKLLGINMRSSTVDDDFADLVSLNRTLQPAQLILLGEQSHGEGSVFTIKVRLIKFLHEKMGFDILAFESSFFACAKAQEQISAGESAKDVAPTCIYPLWSQAAELWPLFEYIEATRKTDRPLILAGFDSRMVPFVGSPSLTRELDQYLHSKNSSAVRDSSWSSTIATIDSLLKREREYSMTQAHWDSLDRGLAIIERDLQSNSSTDMESRFWLKVLANVSATSEILRIPLTDWKRSNSVRDRQLADNLLWLLNVRYPGKKIIAWTASYHAARRLPEIHFSGMAPYDSVLTMGDTLYSALGSRLYSVAFTGYSGGYSDWTGQPESVDSAATGSLEDMMNQTGFAKAFFDLRGQPKYTDLAKSEFFARPLGYNWRPAIWPHHFDAIVFERNITPSTRVSE
jgi:erythromycin esterase